MKQLQHNHDLSHHSGLPYCLNEARGIYSQVASHAEQHPFGKQGKLLRQLAIAPNILSNKYVHIRELVLQLAYLRHSFRQSRACPFQYHLDLRISRAKVPCHEKMTGDEQPKRDH